jgi:hypothetical protein
VYLPDWVPPAYSLESTDMNHVLYRNNGDGTYTDVADDVGAARFEWGWSGDFSDFNNDGHVDIVFAGSKGMNGFPFIGEFLGNPGTMLLNDGAGNFSPIDPALPINLEERFSQGTAVSDFDLDGFVDVAISTTAFPGAAGGIFVLHNQGNSNNAATILLQGSGGNTGAIGARISLETAAGTQIRDVEATSSWLAQDSRRKVFGIADDTAVTRVVVRWPDGSEEEFDGAGITLGGTVNVLVQGTGTAL